MDEHSSTPPAMPDPMSPGGPPPTPPIPPGPPAALPIPWERPGYPVLPALFETTKLFLTSPTEAYARVSRTLGVGRPFFYGCVVVFVMNFFSSFYQLVARSVMGNALPGFLGREMTIPPVAMFVGNVLVSPFLIPICVLLAAGVTHLFLMLLGGARGGYTTTLRGLSYSYAPSVLGIVPACGVIVGSIWSIVLCVIGLAALHETSRGKVLAAVLLPFVLCCACLLPLFLFTGLKGLIPR